MSTVPGCARKPSPPANPDRPPRGCPWLRPQDHRMPKLNDPTRGGCLNPSDVQDSSPLTNVSDRVH